MRSESPWSRTPIIGGYAEQYVPRPVIWSDDDIYIKLEEKYRYNPSLLAHDLFGEWRLWWVIPQMNGLEDPTFDLEPGRFLRSPSYNRARSYG